MCTPSPRTMVGISCSVYEECRVKCIHRCCLAAACRPAKSSPVRSPEAFAEVMLHLVSRVKGRQSVTASASFCRGVRSDGKGIRGENRVSVRYLAGLPAVCDEIRSDAEALSG